MSKLTVEQIRALDNSHHISLLANAGSGKTSVLVEKYINIITDEDEDCQPNEILAITFTNKAAAEIKRKILLKLDEKIEQQRVNSRLYKKWRKIREKVIFSTISTIHSFCQQLLNQYPVEAKLNPNFTDISDEDYKELISKYVNDLFYTPDENLLEKFEYLYRAFSYKNLVKLFVFLLSSQERYFLFKKNFEENSYFNIEFVKEKYQSKYDLEYITLCQYLIELSDIIQLKLDEELIKNNLITNDLRILKTNLLLDNQEVKSNFISNYKHVFIDEYQDTNYYQFEIVKKIILDFQSENIQDTSNKLFIVGDPKQNIYQFRNSHYKLFLKTRDLIIETNKSKSTSLENNHYNDGNLKLTITFRLNPIVATFTNLVCTKLFSNINGDIEYEEMVIPKNKFTQYFYSNNAHYSLLEEFENEGVDLIIIEEKIEAEEAIELEENDGEDESNEENNIIHEKILKYINSIIGLKTVNKPEGIDYSDIAILFRSNNNLNQLSEYLIKNNIPVTSKNKDNLLDYQEIMDLVSYLQFVYNPSDDLAFLSILRAPFFNFDDSFIIKLSENEKDITLKDKFDEIVKSLDNKWLNSIQNTLNFHITISGRITAAQMVLLIINDTLWNKNINRKSNAEGIRENIGYFIDYIRNYENIGVKDFKLYLDNLFYGNEIIKIKNENLASYGVNLLTIHSAKGLEFEVVILNSEYFKEKNINSPAFTTDSELFIDNINTIENNVYTKRKFSEVKKGIPISQIIVELKNKLKIEQSNEINRLLYVALTRAKAKLAIIYPFKKNKNIMGQFSKFIDTTILSDHKKQIKFEIESKLKLYDSDTDKFETVHLNIPFKLFKSDDHIVLVKPIEEKIDLPLLNLKEISSYENNVVFSASKLAIYSNTSNEFIKKTIYGYNPFEKANIINIDESEMEDNSSIFDELELKSNEYGLVLHKFFENFHFNRENINNIEYINITIKNSFQGFEKYFNDNQFQNIKLDINNILSNKLITDNLSYLENAKKELFLIMPYNDNFLQGTLDLLFLKENNHLEIWDWKTNSFDEMKNIDSISQKYITQIKIYSYLAFFKYKVQSITFKLIFTKLISPGKEESEFSKKYYFEWNELISIESEISNLMKDIQNDYFGKYE